jgi:hypothetical protein
MKEKIDEIKTKIAVTSCRSLKKEHLILQYNVEKESFEVKALHPVAINGKTVTVEDGFVELLAMD